MESNRSERDHGHTWNGIEQNGKGHRESVNRKGENVRESVIGPQGAGPCARVNEISYRRSRPNKWTRPIGHGTLRVTCDSWCHASVALVSYTKEIIGETRRKKKDRPSKLA